MGQNSFFLSAQVLSLSSPGVKLAGVKLAGHINCAILSYSLHLIKPAYCLHPPGSWVNALAEAFEDCRTRLLHSAITLSRVSSHSTDLRRETRNMAFLDGSPLYKEVAIAGRSGSAPEHAAPSVFKRLSSLCTSVAERPSDVHLKSDHDVDEATFIDEPDESSFTSEGSGPAQSTAVGRLWGHLDRIAALLRASASGKTAGVKAALETGVEELEEIVRLVDEDGNTAFLLAYDEPHETCVFDFV